MQALHRALSSILTAGLLLGTLHAASKEMGHWPQYRGIAASGRAEGHATPTVWDVAGGKNVLWKTPIPGLGHSSPIVWGDRVYVTTAISGQPDDYLKVGLYGNIEPVEDDSVHKWKVYALDRITGEIVWERTAHEGVPRIKRHTKASHANSTPATDGKHLVVFFGSEGLYGFNARNGKLLWKKDLGVLDAGFFRVPDAQWEYGASPVIHDGKVVVQCDVLQDSFLAAFDVKTGKELWRTPRDEVPTWSTPTVHDDGERAQVIVNGYKHIGGYDLSSGKELWKMTGGGDIPVPTPIVENGLIYITNAHGGGAPVYAVDTGARGDVTLEGDATSNEFVAWAKLRMGAYMQTPIVYGDLLYVCRDNGVLTVFEAASGRKLSQVRLGTGRTGFTASAVAADGKLYYTSEIGDVYVVRAGAEVEVLAENAMGEICMATPAISRGVLFFRTRGHVVAVGGGS